MSEDRRRGSVRFVRSGSESAHLFSYAQLFAFNSKTFVPLLALGDGPRLRGVQKALLLDKADGDS